MGVGMADPERLAKGARVCLPGDDDVVTLVQVTQGAFWEIVYRGSDGSLGEVTLPEAELPEIKLKSSAGPVRFSDAARPSDAEPLGLAQFGCRLPGLAPAGGSDRRLYRC